MNITNENKVEDLKTELRVLEDLKKRTEDENILKFLSDQVQTTQSQILLLI